MPRLPTVQARGELGALDLPNVIPGEPIAQGFRHLSEVLQNLQEGTDRSEAAKIVSVKRAEIDKAIQQSDFESPDAEVFYSTAAGRVEELRKGAIELGRNARQKQLIQDSLADDIVRSQLKVEHRKRQKQQDQVIGNLDALEISEADRVVNATDVLDKERAYRTYATEVGNAAGLGFLKPGEMVKRLEKFEKTIKTRTANVMLRTDAAGLLTALYTDQFSDMDNDEREKWADSARARIRHEDTLREQTFNKDSAMIKQEWYSRLGSNQLTDAEIQDAIDNKNAFITPQEGLEFKKKKESGDYGAGSTPVKALRQEYRLGQRTTGRIAKYRQALDALIAEMPGYNKDVSNFGDELQSDETQLTGIEAARINRDVTAAKEKYDAENPAPPFRIPGLDSQRQQDKAKVGQAVRTGKDPTPLIQKGKAETKAKVDAIPQKYKDVIGY